MDRLWMDTDFYMVREAFDYLVRVDVGCDEEDQQKDQDGDKEGDRQKAVRRTCNGEMIESNRKCLEENGISNEIANINNAENITVENDNPSDTIIAAKKDTIQTKQTFHIFAGLLRFYSGYFNGCLNHTSIFTEATTHHISLPTEDPRIFSLFAHWIQTRTFFPSSTLDPILLMEWDTLIDLWIFADRRDVPLLGKEVIEMMGRKMRCNKCLMPVEAQCRILEETLPGSALSVFSRTA